MDSEEQEEIKGVPWFESDFSKQDLAIAKNDQKRKLRPKIDKGFITESNKRKSRSNSAFQQKVSFANSLDGDESSQQLSKHQSTVSQLRNSSPISKKGPSMVLSSPDSEIEIFNNLVNS